MLYQVKREHIKQKVILIQEAIFLLSFLSGVIVKAPHKQSGRIYCIIDGLLWLLQKLFGRQRHNLFLTASIPGFLFTGTSPWIIKEISDEIWPFCLHSCLTNSSCRTVKFAMLMLKLNSVGSSRVSFCLPPLLTGSHPDGDKPRGEAAPTENYESTIPLLLKGKDPRPLSQLRTGVRALITGWLTFHLSFPRTVTKDRWKMDQTDL